MKLTSGSSTKPAGSDGCCVHINRLWQQHEKTTANIAVSVENASMNYINGKREVTPVQLGAEARVKARGIYNQDGAGDHIEQLRAIIREHEKHNREFWDRIWAGLRAWRRTDTGRVQ